MDQEDAKSENETEQNNNIENEDNNIYPNEENANEQETCSKYITGNSVYDKELYNLCKKGFYSEKVYMEIDKIKFGFGDTTNKEEHLEDYGSQLIQFLGMESTLDTLEDYQIEVILNAYTGIGYGLVKKEILYEAYYQIFGKKISNLDYLFEEHLGVSDNFYCIDEAFGSDILVEFKEKEILNDKALLKYEVTDLFSENKDKYNVLLTLIKDDEQYHFKSTEIIN